LEQGAPIAQDGRSGKAAQQISSLPSAQNSKGSQMIDELNVWRDATALRAILEKNNERG
jgi:hypothetical protein